MTAGLFRGAVFFVALISGIVGAGDGFGLTNRPSTESLTAGTYNIRVAVRTKDIDYWINTRRYQVFESIEVNQPDFMGFQEAYARRANGAGVTQQTALGQLFDGTQWEYFSWEAKNVFNMNPFIVNTDRFAPVDSGSMTVNFEDFLGPEGWDDYFELHRFFHGDKNGNVHYLGPERYVNWVVADDIVGGGRIAFLTSHYETYIGENHRGSEYDNLFAYWSGLVNSSFGYASEQILVQAELLKDEWGDLEVIICGDFETTDPDLPAQRVYTDAGHVETWRFINGNGRRPTRGIDNMFVMPDGFTINDSYYDEAAYTNGASDHKPLYADVTQSSVVAPATLTDVTRTLGLHISGGVPELLASDDSYYVLQSGPGFDPGEPHPARADFTFDSAGFAAGTIDITLEEKANIGGPTAVVLLRNHVNSEWDELNRFSLSPTDQTFEISGLPAVEYIGGSGNIEVRVRAFALLVLDPAIRGIFSHDFVGVRMHQ